MCSTGKKATMVCTSKTKKNKIPRKRRATSLSARSRETQDDEDRDSKRQRLSSAATHHSKPQHAGVLKYWDHVNGGELCARGVQKARQLEVEYPNKMSVVDRVPYSLVKHKTGPSCMV